jgi:hypothetical protein
VIRNVTKDDNNLDKLAKEFRFVQIIEGPQVRTARAQMATLFAQEEISEPYQIFEEKYLRPPTSPASRYRGPGQTPVIKEAEEWQQSRINSELDIHLKVQRGEHETMLYSPQNHLSLSSNSKSIFISTSLL